MLNGTLDAAADSAATAVTERLAAFIAAARWEDVPDAVRHEAKRCVVNFFATTLAGCRDPAVAIAVDLFGGYRANETATIIGRRERTDALNAASLNAMSANVFDFDDTHIPTIIHPTAPVAPALFALAETAPMTGQDFLLAFILGVDVECRIGNAISPGHYQRGWHITSTCGIFGAAAATARAMGLDARQVHWALGTASAQSSGLVETLGTMSKSVGVGNAARNGLLSSLLAARGFSGPDHPLEGARGFLKVMGTRIDPESLLGRLGDTWEIRSNTYKPYPCGVVLNPVIDACLDLRTAAGFDPASIETVELRGHPLLRQRTDRPDIRSGRQSQVSAQHAAAVTLLRGTAGLDDFSDAAVADPPLRALGAKVRFVDDDTYSVEAAQVTLVAKGGERLTRYVATARGSLENPLSDAALERKLVELARHGGSGCDTGALIDAIWSLDRAADAAAPLALAAARP